ncbi:MAG: ATP-binding cassette subfamily B multidrug efflux pump [Myxococcota bacterium]|jgi:ATP-binding cassette subfamily B multidrug efflux pump
MAKPADTDWGRLGRLVPYLRQDMFLWGVAMASAPVSAALVVLQPWLLKYAIDETIIPGDMEGLRVAAGAYLASVVVGFLAQSTYTLTLSYAAMKTIGRLRRAVYAHTLSRAQVLFDRVPTGRLLTRTTSDVDALGETLSAGAITIVLDVLSVGGILVAMAVLDLRLTMLLALIAPPLAIALELIRRTLRRLYLRVRTTLASLNAYLAERLSGVRVVQLYGDEARSVTEFDSRLYAYRDATIRTNVWDALLYAVVDGLSSITMAMMLWYAASGWFDGVITAGLLAAFIDYIGKLFTPIREFSAKLAVIQRASSALEKIFGLLDNPSAITPGTLDPGDRFDSLELRDVSFAYGDGPDVLRGVSISVQPGEVVALVGRTGSGKTTIGKLLIRAYDGYTGSILLNGVELRDARLDRVRQLVGMVHQDVQVYPADVRFNLSLGHALPDATLTAAAKAAHAEQAIDRLGGLDATIGHNGRNLSVGEAQLLSFARTLAHDPPFVILDEATASVDSLTEAKIQHATDHLLQHKTVLVIAHRLSTITHSDRIVVMGGGEVLEQGSHSELLQQAGAYAELFNAQFDDEAA